MATARQQALAWFAAALLLGLPGSRAGAAQPAAGQHHQGRLREALQSCWKPPPASRANPIDITVIVSFNREGSILGHPEDHL